MLDIYWLLYLSCIPLFVGQHYEYETKDSLNLFHKGRGKETPDWLSWRSV